MYNIKRKKEKELKPFAQDIRMSKAPKGYIGNVKYISMTPSGIQTIIIGKGKYPSKTDKKFLIENNGVRQLYGTIGRENITNTKIKVFTGKESWNKNLITNFKIE